MHDFKTAFLFLTCPEKYTEQKRNFTLQMKKITQLITNANLKKYVYVNAARRTRQTYENVSKLIRSLMNSVDKT